MQSYSQLYLQDYRHGEQISSDHFIVPANAQGNYKAQCKPAQGQQRTCYEGNIFHAKLWQIFILFMDKIYTSDLGQKYLVLVYLHTFFRPCHLALADSANC